MNPTINDSIGSSGEVRFGREETLIEEWISADKQCTISRNRIER
jgi:hypothetical protein